MSDRDEFTDIHDLATRLRHPKVIPALLEWPETLDELKRLKSSGVITEARLVTRGGETMITELNGVTRDNWTPDEEYRRYLDAERKWVNDINSKVCVQRYLAGFRYVGEPE